MSFERLIRFQNDYWDSLFNSLTLRWTGRWSGEQAQPYGREPL